MRDYFQSLLLHSLDIVRQVFGQSVLKDRRAILQYRSKAGAIKGDNDIHGNAGPF